LKEFEINKALKAPKIVRADFQAEHQEESNVSKMSIVSENTRLRRGRNYKEDKLLSSIDIENAFCRVKPHPEGYLKASLIMTAKEYKDNLKDIDWLPVKYDDK
jgi:hypothetical protein